MNDRHFDELATRFAEKIYGGAKGAIRLAVLQADLADALPDRPLRVLDIGAGLGHMALWLAERGHQLTLAEPAAPMLEGARTRFADAGHGRTCSVSSPSPTIWCCATPCSNGWPSQRASCQCCTN
jgi:S-adenosylmethionine-dependent methyltransferase